MNELKPCPFCGSPEVKMYSFEDASLHGFLHLCKTNGDAMVKIESRLYSTEEKAIEAWNRRAGEQNEDKALPSAEPEIIHCDECKWGDWYTTLDGHRYCYCMESGNGGRTEADFCSYAERESDERSD